MAATFLFYIWSIREKITRRTAVRGDNYGKPRWTVVWWGIMSLYRISTWLAEATPQNASQWIAIISGTIWQHRWIDGQNLNLSLPSNTGVANFFWDFVFYQERTECLDHQCLILFYHSVCKDKQSPSIISFHNSFNWIPWSKNRMGQLAIFPRLPCFILTNCQEWYSSWLFLNCLHWMQINPDICSTVFDNEQAFNGRHADLTQSFTQFYWLKWSLKIETADLRNRFGTLNTFYWCLSWMYVLGGSKIELVLHLVWIYLYLSLVMYKGVKL